MALFGCGFVLPFSIFVVFYTLTYKALKSKGKVFKKYSCGSKTINECLNQTTLTVFSTTLGASLKQIYAKTLK